jgi:hypothetical protein
MKMARMSRLIARAQSFNATIDLVRRALAGLPKEFSAF